MATHKQWGKRVVAFALAAIVALGAFLATKPTTAKADWVKYQGAYYYRYDNGTWAKNAWVQYKGTWYYIGSDYKAASNTWAQYGGSWYYLGKDGKVATDTWVQYDESWYYLGKDGKVATDTWVNYKGSWYYVYDSGEAVIDDFIWYEDECYYFGADGKLVIGSWIEYWGSYYYAGKDGKLVRNKAFTYEGAWYYLDENGWLVCDWSILHNGTIYRFGPDGKLIGTEPAGEPITVEPKTILDTPYFKVTVTGIMGYMVGEGPELYLTVENKTDKVYELHFEEVCVNDWQLNVGFGIDANPGVSKTSICLSNESLEKCGIDQVAKIEFALSVHDPETEEDVYSPDHVAILTSAAATYVQKYDESGTVVYDQGGYKLVVKGYAEDELDNKGIELYIHNATDRDIFVGMTSTKVNGIPLESFSFTSCLSGKHALDNILFLSFDLEDAGITDIHQITTAFEILDSETYEVCVTTPVVTLNF